MKPMHVLAVLALAAILVLLWTYRYARYAQSEGLIAPVSENTVSVPVPAPKASLVTQACFDWEYYLANSPDLKQQYNSADDAYRHYAGGVFSAFGNRRWRDKCTGQLWQGSAAAAAGPVPGPATKFQIETLMSINDRPPPAGRFRLVASKADLDKIKNTLANGFTWRSGQFKASINSNDNVTFSPPNKYSVEINLQMFSNGKYADVSQNHVFENPMEYTLSAVGTAAPAFKPAPALADGYYDVQFYSSFNMLKTLDWLALRDYVEKNPGAQFYKAGSTVSKYHFVFNKTASGSYSENAQIQSVIIHKIEGGKSTKVEITSRDMGVNSQKENLKTDTVKFRVADFSWPVPKAAPAPYAVPKAAPAPYAVPKAAPAPYAVPKAAPAPYAVPKAAPAPADNFYDVQFYSAKNMLMKLDFMALRAFVENNPTVQFFMRDNPTMKWHFEFKKNASGYVQNGIIQGVTIYKNGQEVGTTVNDMGIRSVKESDRTDGVPDTVSFRVADFSWPVPKAAPAPAPYAVPKAAPAPYAVPKPAPAPAPYAVPKPAPAPAPAPYAVPRPAPVAPVPAGSITEIKQLNLLFRDQEAIIKDAGYDKLLETYGIENWIEFHYGGKTFRMRFLLGRDGTDRARYVDLESETGGTWVAVEAGGVPGEPFTAINITGKKVFQRDPTTTLDASDGDTFRPENVTITDLDGKVVYDTSTAQKLKLQMICRKP